MKYSLSVVVRLCEIIGTAFRQWQWLRSCTRMHWSVLFSRSMFVNKSRTTTSLTSWYFLHWLFV